MHSVCPHVCSLLEFHCKPNTVVCASLQVATGSTATSRTKLLTHLLLCAYIVLSRASTLPFIKHWLSAAGVSTPTSLPAQGPDSVRAGHLRELSQHMQTCWLPQKAVYPHSNKLIHAMMDRQATALQRTPATGWQGRPGTTSTACRYQFAGAPQVIFVMDRVRQHLPRLVGGRSAGSGLTLPPVMASNQGSSVRST